MSFSNTDLFTNDKACYLHSTASVFFSFPPGYFHHQDLLFLKSLVEFQNHRTVSIFKYAPYISNNLLVYTPLYLEHSQDRGQTSHVFLILTGPAIVSEI